MFSTVDALVASCIDTARAANKPYHPLMVWGLLDGANTRELCLVGKALLYISPTEAAAERSFSIQQDVHRPNRNCLSQELVEAEMRIKWNSRRVPAISADEEFSDDE